MAKSKKKKKKIDSEEYIRINKSINRLEELERNFKMVYPDDSIVKQTANGETGLHYLHDDIYINELSNIIGDYIDNSLNIPDHFYTIRQYIILTQHEDTMLPYKYEGKEGYVELKNNLKKICNVIYNLKPFDEER